MRRLVLIGSRLGKVGFIMFKSVIDPPRGVNRRSREDWLEKNPTGFFDCAPSGAAAFIITRLNGWNRKEK
jgi:hypothetical protein